MAIKSVCENCSGTFYHPEYTGHYTKCTACRLHELKAKEEI